MARIQASRFVLAVRDLKISTDYYVNVLGFTRDAIEAEGWSFLSRNTVLVMLGECRNEKPASELGDHSYFAYWNADKVDELYNEFLAKGAILTSRPQNKPWGLREFSLRPPDGHRITCGQVL